MNYLRAIGSIFLVSIAFAFDAFAQTGTGLTAKHYEDQTFASSALKTTRTDAALLWLDDQLIVQCTIFQGGGIELPSSSRMVASNPNGAVINEAGDNRIGGIVTLNSGDRFPETFSSHLPTHSGDCPRSTISHAAFKPINPR